MKSKMLQRSSSNSAEVWTETGIIKDSGIKQGQRFHDFIAYSKKVITKSEEIRRKFDSFLAVK